MGCAGLKKNVFVAKSSLESQLAAFSCCRCCMWASHVPLLAMTQFPNLLAMMISLSLAARQQRQRQQAATATAKAKLFLLFVPLRCSPLNRGQISWPGCPKMANNKMQNERKRGSENLWQRRCRRR